MITKKMINKKMINKKMINKKMIIFRIMNDFLFINGFFKYIIK